jgi:hypothetical protein
MSLKVPAVLAATAAALAAGAAVTSAGQGGGAAQKTLTLGIVTTSLTVVDTGVTGSSPGDIVTEVDDVTRGGKTVGTAQIACTAISGDLANGRAECSGTFYLGKGRLETQGGAASDNGAISGAGAVTGGTGRYHAYRGSYTFAPTGQTRTIKFKLVP